MICFLHYDILAKNCSAVTTDRGSEIATLRSDDGNEKVKEAIGFEKQNNNFARAAHFFVHFSAVTARLRDENA